MEKEKCQPDNKLSMVQKAAKLMNKSPQFIRIGLRNGNLPIGSAVLSDSGKWSYYISPKLFYEFTGKEISE